ncbi:MAG TPA: chorismate-binding protein [Acidimicrobiales bacterium]|nr:chorismate-binding protein [Acidimicrobiales bacterium]
MTVRCRFDDLSAGRAFELAEPSTILTTSSLDRVVSVLHEVDDAIEAGGCVAGFVAYEAAPAFDPALCVAERGVDALPLVWFGVFAERREVDVVDVPDRELHLRWHWSIDRAQFDAALSAIQGEIASGWTYQVNLTAQLAASFRDQPIEIYRQLVHAQRGAHHGLIETDEFAVACGSPELFFAVERGRVTTRPMKGTARRGRFAAEDVTRAQALITSSKERAENLMIVDLLRNDLGKVAPIGSVETPSLFSLEQYPTVWQMTSTVAAEIGHVSLAMLFSALFPCGSVTGAPKASTMAIIARLEEAPRGPYCGALGWADGSGESLRASFAVPIRTAVIDRVGERMTYGVGSGITVDSSVDAEWSELGAKAAIVTEPIVPHPLLETLRFSAVDGFIHLDRHLRRLEASANLLGHRFDRTRVDEALASVVTTHGVARVRILLAPCGAVTVEAHPMGEEPVVPIRLGLSRIPVDRADRRLFVKTTDRSRYDECLFGAGSDVDDVILWNAEGEVTETSRANLAVRLDGRWWTPPLRCGLLPGVGREILLEEGVVEERPVTIDELRGAEGIDVVSSMRGRLAATFVEHVGTVPGLVGLAGGRG